MPRGQQYCCMHACMQEGRREEMWRKMLQAGLSSNSSKGFDSKAVTRVLREFPVNPRVEQPLPAQPPAEQPPGDEDGGEAADGGEEGQEQGGGGNDGAGGSERGAASGQHRAQQVGYIAGACWGWGLAILCCC